jgi:hypothetical protein
MARRPFQQRDQWPPGHLFEKQVGLELPLMEDGGNNNFYGDEVSFVCHGLRSVGFQR